MAKHVYVKGLEGVALALRRLPIVIGSRGGGPVRGALFAAAKIIRDDARAKAPVGKGTPMPGNLRRQIYAYRARDPQRSGVTERYTIGVRGTGPRKRDRKREPFGQLTPRNEANVIGGNAYYWRFVEFGTVKQPPQAFMRRAFEENKTRAVNKFTEEMRKVVFASAEQLRKMALRKGRRR
jgi:HK97 gp10 family phage protein